MSARRAIGFVLIAVCAIAWLAIAVLPFTGVTLAKGAAISAVLIAFGEGAFVLGLALLGKDVVVYLRALVNRLKDETGRR
jgi:hypothetical protein